MPFQRIFERAFGIVRREPALWIVGMLFVLFGGGTGVNISFNSSVNPSGDDPNMGLPPEIAARVEQWFSQVTPETLLTFAVSAGVGLVVVSLLFGLVWLYLQAVTHAGLIYGTQRSALGEDVRWGQLLRYGWSAKGRSLFVLKFLLGIPSLITSSIIVGTVLFGLYSLFTSLYAAGVFEDSSVGGSPQPTFTDFAPLFGTIALAVCVGLIGGITQWVLNMAGNYAARALVLEGQSVGAAWRQGWQLFRSNPANSVIMWFLLAIVSGVLQFLVSAVVAIPFFVLVFALVVGEVALIPATVIGGLAYFALFALGALLIGPVQSYIESVWTLTYDNLHRQQISLGEVPQQVASSV